MATHWKRNVHYENQLSQKYPTNRERDIATKRKSIKLKFNTSLSMCNNFSVFVRNVLNELHAGKKERSNKASSFGFSTKTASFSKRGLNFDFSEERSSTVRSNEVMWLFNWWFPDVRTKANWISYVEVDIRVQQASGCFGYHQASYVR